MNPEWPKTAEEIWAAIEVAGNPDDLPDIAKDDQFIPDEIGRELYEASQPFKRMGSSTKGEPFLVRKEQVERLHAALDRYEREVGRE